MSEKDDNNLFNSEKIGLCIKDQNKNVIFQNSLCKKVCNERAGTVCTDHCMSKYDVMSGEEQVFNEGIRNFHHIQMPDAMIDATVVNDSDKITTIFYRVDEHHNEQMDYFKNKGLTKTEMSVISNVLHGKTNNEIAKQMFVSKATLKTHLNNIYKKIPQAMKNLLSRNRN